MAALTGMFVSVLGKSMLPAVWPGDVVWVEKVAPETLRVGDLIFVGRGEGCVMHRIKQMGVDGLGQLSFVTRGDAMPYDDPSVHQDQILGKIKALYRGKREIRNFASRTRWQRAFGVAFANSGPLGTFASRLIDEKRAWSTRNSRHASVSRAAL